MVKVFSEIMSAASRWRQPNQLRYYIALRILDTQGCGWVTLAQAQESLSIQFGVKPKTVLNNLYKVQNAGLGSFSEDRTRFYYKNQERALYSICGEGLKTNNAVLVGLEHLTTSHRAFFETAPLAHNDTMSRKTREEIGGRTARTQRKYEEELGIIAKRNCAIMCPATDYELRAAEENKLPVFTTIMDGQLMLMRHLPNSYTVGHEPTRKYTLKLNRQKWATRVFFDDTKEAVREWCGGFSEVYMRRTHGAWVCLRIMPQ